MKKLTKAEFTQTKLHELEQRILSEEKKNLDLFMQNETLKFQLLQEKFNKKIKMIKEEMDHKDRQKGQLSGQIREFNNKIKEKYKLGDSGWGINPDTGEFIEEE